VPGERSTRWIRILGGVVGGVYLTLGAFEFVTHLDDPGSLAFWLPSLWGGGALVLYGVFGRPSVSAKLVTAGALLGMIATAWTLILPVLAIALVVLTFNSAQRGPARP
jgi:hypothetical protein